MKSWQIIADNLSKTGWSLGWVSAVDSQGRTTWIVDAHRDDGKRFVVGANGLLTAFLELEASKFDKVSFPGGSRQNVKIKALIGRIWR